MNSPLDAFPSESSADAQTRHAMVLSTDARPGFRRTRRTTRINRARRRLIGAVDGVADAIADAAAFMLTLLRRMTTRRRHPIHRPAWASHDRLAVIATAALTSAAVTELTLWLGSEPRSRAEPPMAAVSAQVDRGETSVAPALSAYRPPVQFSREAAPIVPEPPVDSAPTPTPALRTPPPLAPLMLAKDYAEPQDGTPPQDWPVLMDARMPVGTSGPAPQRPAPVASLASGRERAGSSAGRRENSRESGRASGREARAAAPSAAASLGLVVITQPEGARVTINGVGWGITPLTIGHLPPGAKRIRVTKPGYRSEERVVQGRRAC